VTSTCDVVRYSAGTEFTTWVIGCVGSPHGLPPVHRFCSSHSIATR